MGWRVPASNRRRGTTCYPVIGIEPGQNSKEFRFDGVTPMFEAGEVLLPKNALWLPDYIRELLTFPEATYDDQVDSTSQALAWMRRCPQGGVKKLIGAAEANRAELRIQAETSRGTLNLVGG